MSEILYNLKPDFLYLFCKKSNIASQSTLLGTFFFINFVLTGLSLEKIIASIIFIASKSSSLNLLLTILNNYFFFLIIISPKAFFCEISISPLLTNSRLAENVEARTEQL